MAYEMKISSFSPVKKPSDEVNFTVSVRDDQTGEPLKKGKVTFKVAPEKYGATIRNATLDLGENGRVTNVITCSEKASLIITASVESEDLENDLEETLPVGFSNPDLAEHKIIPEPTKEGVLEGRVLSGDIQIRIKRHTNNPAPGDMYTFFWGNESRSRYDEGDNFPWVINIKKQFNESSVLSDGNYSTYYTIEDDRDNVSYSLAKDVTIVGSSLSETVYEPPFLPGLKNNTLNVQTLFEKEFVEIIIPSDQDVPMTAKIEAGDIVTLYMRVNNQDGREIKSTSVINKETTIKTPEEEQTIEVAREFFHDKKNTFDNVKGQIWYTIADPNTKQTKGVSRIKNIIIDTVPPHMPAPYQQ